MCGASAQVNAKQVVVPNDSDVDDAASNPATRTSTGEVLVKARMTIQFSPNRQDLERMPAPLPNRVVAQRCGRQIRLSLCRSKQCVSNCPPELRWYGIGQLPIL